MAPKAETGKLEVVCGPMFSGKSEELIRRLRRAKIAKQRVVVFKPALDTRYATEQIVSHNGMALDAYATDNPQDIIDHVIKHGIDVVGIDEVQFFPKEIINAICQLVALGKQVIVGGLDLDFRGVPFGPMPTLLAIADEVTKLQAICSKCGCNAHFSQRLVNGKPAKFNDPIILVGAQETYQARCRGCYSIDQAPQL
jgi:thymidine kinase